MADDYSKASELAQDLIDDGEDFRTLTREELKDHFEIARLEDVRVDRICDACNYAGLIMYPVPKQDIILTRVYLKSSKIGKVISSILSPGTNTESDLEFEQSAKRIYSATPTEVYKKIKNLFIDEEWVKLKSPK